MARFWTVDEAKELIQSAKTLRSWGREQDALDTAQAAYDTLENAGKEPYYRVEAAEIIASLLLSAHEPEKAIAIADRRDGLDGFEARMDRLRGRVAAALGDRDAVLRVAAKLRTGLTTDADLWEDLEGAHWLDLIGEDAAAAAFREAWVDAASDSPVLSYHLDVASLLVSRFTARRDDARLGAAMSAIDRALYAGEHSGASRQRSREAASAFFRLIQMVPEHAPPGPWMPRHAPSVLPLCEEIRDRMDDIPAGQRPAVRVELARAFEGCGDAASARPLWRDAFGYLRHLRLHGPHHADYQQALEGLVRTRRTLGAAMEQEEATTLIAPALWRAFPDRASRMLLEINAWFRKAWSSPSTGEHHCSFCGRPLEWAQSSSASSLEEGVWVSLCFSCRHSLSAELSAEASPRPDVGAVLTDTARALRGAGVVGADDVMEALGAAAATARVAADGACSFCPDDGVRRRMWHGPDARICERCARETPRIVAA